FSTPVTFSFLFRLVMIQPPPQSPLLPYTTLFRSEMPRMKEDPSFWAALLAWLSLHQPQIYAGLTAGLTALVRVIYGGGGRRQMIDRKSTRLNSSHVKISYAVFCLKKKRSIEMPES